LLLHLLPCFQSTPPPLLCVPFQFLVHYSVFWGFLEVGSGCQGTMLVYPTGSCGSTTCHLFAHLLVCISPAGLEPASGSVEALLFSQGNMAFRSFVGLGVQGIRVLLLLGGFFLSSVATASQQNF
jgi:hypothetical protein